ncbi:MAG TPA: VOC family protein [Noviherbaspirillum sp.]|jgi:catechol 2,3-dioxygenase-like lactoylglutathione lyase family enzyme|uniref:VOC family protein n=1 Tax=Noviherbaspirillum sp. TaxID=1926288 RepID=UPI002F922EDB
MQPRISVLTLGVDNLDRAVAFYRDGLGLATAGIVGAEYENGAVAFFDLHGGIKLALWPRKSMAADTGLPLQDGCRSGLTIGHNVRSRDEVRAVMEQARKAGAHIVKPAADTFYGGYAGYFMDPDGHLWEVVFNPEMLPAE